MTLSEAVERFNSELPGWWWTAGVCSISADASCGPDRDGPDAHLLHLRNFDEGFHVDLAQPASVAEALLFVMGQAKVAKRQLRAQPCKKLELSPSGV